MTHSALIEQYRTGPAKLRAATTGMSREQLAARPDAGKWSTLEVLCHIADFEPVYADRMKRVLAEDNPLLLSGDPDLFHARLAYSQRDAAEELAVVEAVRFQMARILETLSEQDFSRTGKHSVDGPVIAPGAARTDHQSHPASFGLLRRKARSPWSGSDGIADNSTNVVVSLRRPRRAGLVMTRGSRDQSCARRGSLLGSEIGRENTDRISTQRDAYTGPFFSRSRTISTISGCNPSGGHSSNVTLGNRSINSRRYASRSSTTCAPADRK